MIDCIYFCFLYLSFLPLWLSISVRYIVNFVETKGKIHFLFSFLLILIFLLFIFSCYVVYDGLKEGNKDSKTGKYFKILLIKEEKSLTLEYILSYVLPLIAFDFQKPDDAILFLIYFASISFLSVKHHIFSPNFFLELLGYSFYQCTLKEKATGIIIKKMVISKEYILNFKEKTITVYDINNDYTIFYKDYD